MANQQTAPAEAGDGGNIKDRIKSDVSAMAEDVKGEGQQRFEAHKHTAADQSEQLARVLGHAAEELRGQDQQSLADYASQLAGAMKKFADSLRERSLDQLMRDTQQLAREKPTLFVIGSVAVGIALSRFLKASARRDMSGSYEAAEFTTGSRAQPVTFESRPSVISDSAAPSAERAADHPSFADDLGKGA